MTKPKYSSPEERKAAASEQARRQMLAQWERKRAESGEGGPGYFGCHRRVRTQRGRAGDQTCACGKPAQHWAHLHDTDPADVANYEAMCQSCHWKYDEVILRGAETKGAEGRSAAARLAWSRRTPEQRRAIQEKASATRQANREARCAEPDTAPLRTR